MSTSSIPSAWPEPRQRSVTLPSDIHPLYRGWLMACSANRLVLRHYTHVYIYAFPAFDLLRVLGPGEISNPLSLKIHGEILVIVCDDIGLKDPALESSSNSLYFWDLSACTSLGIMTINEWSSIGVSSPETELVESEESGEPITVVWPKDPMLIIISRRRPALQTFILPSPVVKSTEQVATALVKGNTEMLPVVTISLIHGPSCYAFKGRTAVTGGEDGTVCVLDIVAGECRLVLIGHCSRVKAVCLDPTRIYSSSDDNTARIWDRHRGDCLHVLNLPPFPSISHSLRITPSYLITIMRLYAGRNQISIWDPVSGNLIHQVGNPGPWATYPGPILGMEQSLATWEVDEDPSKRWLKVRDVISGQVVMKCSFGRYSEVVSVTSEGSFLMAIVEENMDNGVLRIWDFGTDDSLVRVLDSSSSTSEDNTLA